MAAHDVLAARLAELPAELELTREFPAEVEAEAAAIVAAIPLPERDPAARTVRPPIASLEVYVHSCTTHPEWTISLLAGVGFARRDASSPKTPSRSGDEGGGRAGIGAPASKMEWP